MFLIYFTQITLATRKEEPLSDILSYGGVINFNWKKVKLMVDGNKEKCILCW